MTTAAILKACDTFGTKLVALEGRRLQWTGTKPPAELERVIKLRREDIWNALPPPALPEKNASMIQWLRNLVGVPDVLVWRGERFDVGDMARRLVTAKQDDEWWQDSGRLWCAWMAEDSAWYADLDAMLLCERIS